ncbi:hypothetical protein [Streptomyces luteireticuli]|uniref:hypothetical protein n=1 Tax=Streptomyces luteireticuli TaxID=173858 RepID=UPI0031D0EC23
MSRIGRFGGQRLRAVVLLAAVALGAAAPVPASAHERDPGQVQCLGTETVAYHPGLGLLPRDTRVTVDGRFRSCAGGDGAVRSGGYHEEFTLFTGCNNLLEGFRTRRTYFWNTHDASTAEIAGSSTALAGQVVTPAAGTVTHGRFRGRKVLQLVPLPQPGALQCLSGGVTSASGPTVLTIF